MKTKSILITLLLIISVASFAFLLSQDRQIQHTVDVREGAGSYFDMVARLAKDTQVEALQEDEGWTFIRFADQEGWVPNSALGSLSSGGQRSGGDDDVRSRFDDAFSEMGGGSASDDEQVYASPAEVAAAVKGFARRYKTRRGETVVDLTDNFDRRINIREYRNFRQERISRRDLRRLNREYPIRTDTIPDLSADLDETGWAIANVLAQKGLYQDRELQLYLNYIALLVAEHSHRHEVPVQVHILDDDEILGYAIPGGIIFISKGALRAMRNEAEYANFIGHEIAHLVLQHGLLEMEQQRPRIQADRGFSELDQALRDTGFEGDEYTELQQELSDWADQVYEYLIQGRLEAYEFDADYWGMVYAARAGYSPQAAVTYLQRMLQTQGDFTARDDRGGLEWSGTSIEARIDRLRQVQSRRGYSGGETHEAEFQRMMRRLR